MKKLLTVTIGIPAYNEEKNIGLLLQALLSQEEIDFRVTRIIIILDACTDQTEQIVKKYNDSRIITLTHVNRLGQIAGQNEIFAMSDTDAVILLESDVIPEESDYLYKLLLPMIQNTHVDCIQAAAKPSHPSTWIGKILYKQALCYASTIPGSRIGWLTTGLGGRVFSKRVYTQLLWPRNVPEDVYAYLWCRQKNITIVYNPHAITLYKTAQNVSEFLKRRQKIYSGEITLKTYFAKELTDEVYKKTLWFSIKPSLYFLFRDPFAFFGYACLRIIIYKRLVHKKFSDYWPTTMSTKTV